MDINQVLSIICLLQVEAYCRETGQLISSLKLCKHLCRPNECDVLECVNSSEGVKKIRILCNE